MEKSTLQPSPNSKSGRLQTLSDHQIQFAALFLFILLTIIAAWPVISNLDGLLIGDDNDVYINPWADWWTAKALTNPDISLWNTDYIFHPDGANLVYHSFSHLNTLVSLGLRPYFGSTPAYNITILINIILNGFSMFQLTYYLTKSTSAGILAGIVFAFNNQITYQTAHPVLVSDWCIPWITLFFIRAIRQNSIRFAFIAAVFVFFAAAASTLLLVLAGLWMILLFLYTLFSVDFPRPSLKITAAFGLTSLVLTLPLMYPLILDAITNQNSTFIIQPSESISSEEILSIFIPSWFIEFPRTVYLGVVPAYLGLLATKSLRKQGKLWFLLIFISYLIAIGPDPTLLGIELNIILPWSLAVIPLLRNTYRMMILFAFGWAMIVALGWLRMKVELNLDPRKMCVTAVLIGLLIFVEYNIPAYPTSDSTVSAFYTEYLNNVPNDVSLAIIPTGRQEDKRYLYYQTFHEHPITAGVISRSESETSDFIQNNPLLKAGTTDAAPSLTPDEIQTSLSQLSEVNVGYLIFDKQIMTWTEIDIEAWREIMPIDPIYEDTLVIAYKIDGQ